MALFKLSGRSFLPRKRFGILVQAILCTAWLVPTHNRILAAQEPVRASNGMVVAQEVNAARAGVEVLREGGNAIDAAVATAFALAVTHPAAGNIGGGGFLVYRSHGGEAAAYDFREKAPARSHARMFMTSGTGTYDANIHHRSHISVGVPGTVAGLYLAWQDHGTLPWRRLLAPAVELAANGFVISKGLAESLERFISYVSDYPASVRQFSKDGEPHVPGDTLRQPDLAATLRRIAERGPAGFYEGETAAMIEKEMQKNGGLITATDLKAYRAIRRDPVLGAYRGYEILSMPPPSSGGTALLEMLNVLEGYDLRSAGFGSAQAVHLIAEAMRRAYADRARFLGDPDFNGTMPIQRLISKEYAAELRRSIDVDQASASTPSSFVWPPESPETTHFSVVDRERNAVSLTYTLEQSYGVGAVVEGAGFLLNNEMGDFNAAPGLTTPQGLIGTEPNLAAPGKRMLSSMSPTIVVKDDLPFVVLGSPGGRTIINTVLLILLNIIDFQMDLQEAVDAPRFHHQWLPDRVNVESTLLSPGDLESLVSRGHSVQNIGSQGIVAAIMLHSDTGLLEGAADRREPESVAVGW
jgi:gamma-glutamyltranspeptidase/glutathione hydrolase